MSTTSSRGFGIGFLSRPVNWPRVRLATPLACGSRKERTTPGRAYVWYGADAACGRQFRLENFAWMTLNAFHATDAETDSSLAVWACWIATGKIAAAMMNPMPRIITANSTSTNENPGARSRTEPRERLGGDVDETAARRMEERRDLRVRFRPVSPIDRRSPLYAQSTKTA